MFTFLKKILQPQPSNTIDFTVEENKTIDEIDLELLETDNTEEWETQLMLAHRLDVPGAGKD